MFQRIITFSIENPLIVSIGVVLLIIWGVVSLRDLPIDAVPDITNNQVQVVTLSPALAPQEVERLITVPVEQTMATIDGVVERRSISRFGLSVVTLVFSDDVDGYWARAQVDQRLTEAERSIPTGAGSPTMMPITTGLGEILQYSLRVDAAHSGKYSPMELRTIHDWIIRRGLLGTKGVADVASFGGYLRQLEIAVNPERLAAAGLSTADVLDAVRRNNGNSGGAYIDRGDHVAFIRTEGLAASAADVENIVLKNTSSGLPLLVRDVAEVRDGHAVRYGAMTIADSAEGVGGIVYMLKGANSSQVIDRVKERIAEIEHTLPAGITVVPFLDRSDLVKRTIGTVSTNLIEGALIVIFVLVLMLGNWRAGLIVASVIPLSMLFAVGLMRVFGVSGNLMSLGAIDFGLIVDGAVIIVEHVLHMLVRSKARSPEENVGVIRQAALEIRRSAAFGEGIILIVYLPILTLVGVEGKMFMPMAQTVMFAIVGAFILSATYVPMMSALFLRHSERQGLSLADRIMALVQAAYNPVRQFALRRAAWLLAASGVALVLALVAFLTMGSEFIPTLHEGDFAVETRLETGSSVEATVQAMQKASGILKRQFPEVIGAIGKVGTTEIPLDPMPIESGDLIIMLKPRTEWVTARTRDDLADTMQRALAVLEGVEFGFQQPIQMRFNELMTGARQDVVVQIFGDDLDKLRELGDQVGAIAGGVRGAEDIYVEPIEGLPQVVVRVDREACAVFGVRVDDVNATVRTAFAGEVAGQFFEEERRFDVVVRLAREDRTQVEDLKRLTVASVSGVLIPLGQVANINMIEGPNQIQREGGRRRITVGFNVRDRDVGSIVNELRQRMQRVKLPVGYEVTYGGQFENLAEGSARLAIAVPASLLLILILLYLTFGSLLDAVMVFTAIPLSAIGGVAALLVRGLPFSISAGVGFIALFGVSALNGIVLMAAFRKLRSAHHTNMIGVVVRGTTERIRPVMMTALVASLGFLPMALSTGDGAEVQRPLATVVIGGLITSTLLTMVVLPVLYYVVYRRQAKRHHQRRTKAPYHAVALLFLLLPVAALAQPTVVPRDTVRALALRANLDVIIATSKAAQAERLKGASVDLGPTSLTWMGGQYNAVDFDNAFGISQGVPWPGKLAASSRLYDEQAREAQLESVWTRRTVMVETELAMDRVAYTHELLLIMARLDSILARSVRSAVARQKAGDATQLERVLPESQLSELRARHKQFETQLQNAETQLRVLCGDTAVTIADTLLSRRLLTRDTALAASVSQRYAQRLHTAQAKADVAASSWWPDFTLGYVNQSLIGAPLGNGRQAIASDRFQYVQVGVSLPLWFGPVRAREQQADLDVMLADAEARRRTVHAEHERQQLLRTIRALENSLDHYEGPAREESRVLVEHSSQAYEAGDIGWLELQQSLERALTINLNRLEALLDHNEAVIQLELLTGQQP